MEIQMIKVPYGRQSINQADIDSVIQVLRSDFLTQGPSVPAFENAISEYCKVKYTIAVNSATSALHIACLSLGVKQGDLVWTSPITFVASANCALYCGATVDFVDIDSMTFNINVERLSEKLAQAEKVGRLPKVLIPVHLCGQSCDMLEIHKLSKKYGFKIIEDGSHAIGGKYLNDPIGNCKFSDITIFSFHPVKIITTGEGGVAVTNNPMLAKKMQLLRSHGITSTKSDMESRPQDEICNYQQIDLGFNYRMNDMQAALGLSQLRRLDEFVSKRNEIAKRYDQLFSGMAITTPWISPRCYSTYHLYVIRLKLESISKTQKCIHDALHSKGILVNLHYIPVYYHPFYERMGFQRGYCEGSEKYYREALSIPLYPELTDDQQDFVVNAIRESI